MQCRIRCEDWLYDRIYRAIHEAEEKITMVFVDLYQTFTKGLSPQKLIQVPPVDDLIGMVAFHEVFVTGRHKPVSVIDSEIFSHIPIASLVEKWKKWMGNKILAMNDSRYQLEDLSMAFECTSCSTVLFGLDDARTHCCGNTQLTLMLLSLKDALLNVPQWSGAGLKRASVQAMDERAPECVFRYSTHRGHTQWLTLNWRQYVSG